MGMARWKRLFIKCRVSEFVRLDGAIMMLCTSSALHVLSKSAILSSKARVPTT